MRKWMGRILLNSEGSELCCQDSSDLGLNN